MPALTTGDLELPDHLIKPWLKKVSSGSTIATLTPATPQLFGKGTAMVFDSGEAELVSEGGQKSSNDITKTTQSVEPHKLQKTVRMTEEVLWADEDHQLEALSQILDQIQPALSRGLDYIGIHGINPKTGAVAGSITQKLVDATNIVEVGATDKPYANLDAADALVLAAGYLPSDIALDPAFAAKFRALRGTNSEQRLYPDFRLTTEVSDLDGHRASVSRTVGAVGVAATESDLLGIVGDFSGINWGIQRAIGLEVIRYGDPDGQGDLKRNNQVAFRAEVVYGVGIADLEAYALIKDAA